MPRNDTDTIYEKMPDGTMREVSSALRVVSDEEIAGEQARNVVRTLARRARDTGLTNAEQDRLLVAIARILLREL